LGGTPTISGFINPGLTLWFMVYITYDEKSGCQARGKYIKNSASTFAQFLLSSPMQLLFLVPSISDGKFTQETVTSPAAPSRAHLWHCIAPRRVWLNIYRFSFNRVPQIQILTISNHHVESQQHPQTLRSVVFRVQKSPTFSWLSPKIPTALPKGFNLWEPGPIQIFPFQVLLVPQCMPQDTSKRGFFGISPTYDGSYGVSVRFTHK
jgi:hypothetical protein